MSSIYFFFDLPILFFWTHTFLFLRRYLHTLCSPLLCTREIDLFSVSLLGHSGSGCPNSLLLQFPQQLPLLGKHGWVSLEVGAAGKRIISFSTLCDKSFFLIKKSTLKKFYLKQHICKKKPANRTDERKQAGNQPEKNVCIKVLNCSTGCARSSVSLLWASTRFHVCFILIPYVNTPAQMI